MLTTLYIKNFAIVKELELDFSQGMTAFTGETGAGKSIMIDALMLALGGRADATVIRNGEEKCDISACFQIDPHSEPAHWLSTHDLQDVESKLVLRRVLYSEGRSKSYINGQLFPLQKIKELSEMLVHIHGQHQHQTLLHTATHRQQLDQYAGHDELLNEVACLYKRCQQIQQELKVLKNKTFENDKISLLRFQIDELNLLNVQEDELQSLQQEHQLLHHAQDYLQNTQLIIDLLQADDQMNACNSLNRVLQLLQSLPEQHLAIKNSQEFINNALIQCEEALSEMHSFADQIQLDPERLQEVEQRMSNLHLAARKYQVDLSQLPSYTQQLVDELAQLEASENRVLILESDYKKAMTAFMQAAGTLTSSRKTYALKLAAEISANIQQLGMPKGRVDIEITPLEKMQAQGMDKVEYKVCTNSGMAPDSLSKIASGGELSRISLAIQMITAQRGATPTLLFDEVDVGIGGATAALVGQLLRKLGERLQVFCVTHQAQVAGSAHHHFVVEKHDDDKHTYSHIIPLSTAEKINELARMLGGLKVTEQTRSHAKEMLIQTA